MVGLAALQLPTLAQAASKLIHGGGRHDGRRGSDGRCHEMSTLGSSGDREAAPDVDLPENITRPTPRPVRGMQERPKLSLEGLTVLVLGCGDVGSAVAHRLHGAGAHVLVCDLPRPAHARRGMAYTDALFDGSAELDGILARHVVELADVETCWSSANAIAIVTLPEMSVVADRSFDVAIDATMRRHRTPSDIRALAPFGVGVGPGFAPGLNCHVAIESQWGAHLGSVLDDRPSAPLAGGPKPLDGVGRARFVPAPLDGRWSTAATLGMPVAAGDLVGRIGPVEVAAPIDGRLRGVTRDGVDVRAGQRIVEVDPRAEPQIFGLGERPLAIAAGVLRALGRVHAQ